MQFNKFCLILHRRVGQAFVVTSAYLPCPLLFKPQVMKTIYTNSNVAKFLLKLSKCDIITICFLILSRNPTIPEISISHEKIHITQWLDYFVIGAISSISLALYYNSILLACFAPIIACALYYVVYGIEFVIRLIMYRSSRMAYQNVSLEREAYRNAGNTKYHLMMKFLSHLKYLRNGD